MAPDEDRSGRFIVAAPGTPLEVMEGALKIAWPDDMTEERDGELLPREPRDGTCRICGLVGPLTAEHLPPRGAFNKGRGMDVDPKTRIGNDDLDVEVSGPVIQGGVRAFVLCAECNNFTGIRWGREYQGWAGRGYALLSQASPTVDEMDAHAGFPMFDVTFKRVYPGRFIRQVISMMLSISGSDALARRFPVLRDLVLGGPPAEVPHDVRLYLHLYGDATTRVMGGPNGSPGVDLTTGEVRRVLQLDHPPLGLMLQIEGPPMDTGGADVSEFTTIDVDRQQDVSFEELPLGFGHKMWPNEYRTRGQLLANRIPVDEETEPDGL
ncbi:MAG: hypothetical protein AB7Q27_21350 [Acidimicrobiia bacterium]